MKNRNTRKLLQRYLLGHASEKENQTVDSWYRSFENEDLSLSEAEARATGREIWNRIGTATHISIPEPDRKLRFLHNWRSVAAVFLLLATGTLASLILYQRYSRNRLISWLTISTRTGETKSITLADGSLLTLDAGSTIRIQKDFSRTRKIEITDGQVFFDVKKDAARPFTIQSGELTTTVLGTSFNLCAYQGLHTLSIGVLSGKVSVGQGTALLGVLEKEEELVYDKTSKQYKKIPLDESMTAWQDGILQLNDLSFPEMVLIMEKNFGVKIATTDDAVTRTKYTTELQKTLTPVQAVQVLAAIHHLSIKEKDNQIFLYK